LKLENLNVILGNVVLLAERDDMLISNFDPSFHVPEET